MSDVDTGPQGRTCSSIGYEESSFSRGNMHVFWACGHILDKDSAAIDALVQELGIGSDLAERAGAGPGQNH